MKGYPIFTIFLILTIIFLLCVFVGMFAWVFGAIWGGKLFVGSLIVGFISTVITIIAAKVEF